MVAPLLYALAGGLYVAATVVHARYLRLSARAGEGRGRDLLLLGGLVQAAALAVDLASTGLSAWAAFSARPQQIAFALVALAVFLRGRDRLGVMGAFVAPLAAIVVVATAAHLLLLGATSPMVSARPPGGVQMVLHVATSGLGFAAFTFAYLLAGLYTLKDARLRARRPATERSSLPALETLERATYRVLAAGFLLFSIGAVMGVIGAARFEAPEGAAVRYTFAFLSWACFALVLSLRWLRGWTGRRAVLLVAVGFLANLAVVLLYVFRMARF